MPSFSDEIQVRQALPEDWEVVVDFNCRLAAESEGKQLDPRRIVAGVQSLLADSTKGRYFVACRDGRVVGQLMHTWEWSDWRNGQIWWLQSVYVLPEFRRRGVFRRLFEHLAQQAAADPDVVGLRLYVEEGNRTAQQTYRQLGLEPAGYLVMERIFPK
jgi:GNAT superfamily N-acetyltransferase